MSDKTDSDQDLYGASPRVIGLPMLVITTALPLGVIPSSLSSDSQSWIVYSILWAFDTRFSYQPFNLTTYVILYLALPIYILNILYIRQIMRYYSGRSSRDSAIACGLISVLLPTLIGLAIGGIDPITGEYVFVGAIPIQFIAGLIILIKIPGPELISPWRGVHLSGSVWTRGKTRPADWFDEVFASWEESEE